MEGKGKAINTNVRRSQRSHIPKAFGEDYITDDQSWVERKLLTPLKRSISRVLKQPKSKKGEARQLPRSRVNDIPSETTVPTAGPNDPSSLEIFESRGFATTTETLAAEVCRDSSLEIVTSREEDSGECEEGGHDDIFSTPSSVRDRSFHEGHHTPEILTSEKRERNIERFLLGEASQDDSTSVSVSPSPVSQKNEEEKNDRSFSAGHHTPGHHTPEILLSEKRERNIERFLLGEASQDDSTSVPVPVSPSPVSQEIESQGMNFTPFHTLVRMSQIPEDEEETDEEKITLLQQKLVQVNIMNAKLVEEKASLAEELKRIDIQNNLKIKENKKLMAAQTNHKKQAVKSTEAEDKLCKQNVELEKKLNLFMEENHLLQATLESLRCELDEVESVHEKNKEKEAVTSAYIRAFRGQNDPLSNFYFVGRYQLKYEGRKYCSSEQAYQHTLALFHREKGIAKEIMLEVNPHAIKDLGGRIVKSKAWEDQKVDVMYDILLAKAACSQAFRLALTAEDPKVIFVEAVCDDFWGSGLPYIATCSTSPGKWTGANIMGKLLSRLRGNLQAIPFPSRAEGSKTTTADPLEVNGTIGSSHPDTTKASAVQPKPKMGDNITSGGSSVMLEQNFEVREAGGNSRNTESSSTRSKEKTVDTRDIGEERDILVGDSTIRHVILNKDVRSEKYIMGGARIEHVSDRLPHIIGDAQVGKVMLAVGTNNVSADSVNDIRIKFCDLLKKAKEICPNTSIYVISLPGRKDSVDLNQKTDQVNTILSEICEAYGVIYVKSTPDIQLVSILSRDGLHPTPAGGRLLLEKVSAAVYGYVNLPQRCPFVTAAPQPMGADRVSATRLPMRHPRDHQFQMAPSSTGLHAQVSKTTLSFRSDRNLQNLISQVTRL